MSLWDNINKKRQRIKQGSGEKMRNKGDKGAPTPDQIKRAKGEDMEEGKINQMQVRRQDMAKLAGLYSKAMKAMPGSPKQKALKKQIDQYRRELGLNEASIYREYEPGEDYQRDLKYFQTVIKKLRGKVKSMNKPTRRDPYLEIEVDGVDAKKLRKEIMKDDDGMTQIDEVRQPLTVPKSLAKYVVYKKTGISKIKQVAHLRAMPKGKELDRILDKYNADGVIAMSKIKRNKMQVEAVSPAQQAAIAIAKKEKGEKPQEESRAYRDAMKGMKSRSATRGMATTKKDKDISATDDDRKAANKNIIMQLRKAADLSTGTEVEFERGKGKVSRAQAQAALARFNSLTKPNDKEKFQKSIKSLADIKKILGR